ncbi:MAG: hypothetical protein JXB29_07400 [Sedimentisphaerales bacterium]|nr:hypothetical protein [Sedimentisphaerales bacterium]
MSKKWAKIGAKIGKNSKKDTRNERFLSKSERFLYNFFQVPALLIARNEEKLKVKMQNVKLQKSGGGRQKSEFVQA